MRFSILKFSYFQTALFNNMYPQHLCWTENGYDTCQTRFIEIPEVHGVSHNLSHTDRTRPSLIFLNRLVNSNELNLANLAPKPYPIDDR